MTEEIQKMVEVIKKRDSEMVKREYKKYFATEGFPDKVQKKLIKAYDNNLPINSLVAYYDTTVMNSCKGGILFTSDGMYYKFIGKAVYFQYADIIDMSMSVSEKDFKLKLNSTDMDEYTIAALAYDFDLYVLKEVISDLIQIDKIYGQSLYKSTGKVKKIDLPPEKMKRCKQIIHTASVACGGVGTGLAQIPASDNAVIVPIQITMIVSLGAVFDLNITESAAKSILASAGATVAGRTVSQFLVGWLPVIGNVINTATAAGITEAIGWIAVNNFYERWIEDSTKGRLEGMKSGYQEASGEYERKLRSQAEEFLQQKKDWKKERTGYEELLTEYEKYIEKLEKEHAAIDLLNDIKGIYSGLKGLKNY